MNFKPYRKRPVVIHAAQWFTVEPYDPDAERIVGYYRHPNVDPRSFCKHCQRQMDDHGWIDTLEGGHIVCPGDWIIRGVKGEHYPCKPDIFAVTHNPAGEP